MSTMTGTEYAAFDAFVSARRAAGEKPTPEEAWVAALDYAERNPRPGASPVIPGKNALLSREDVYLLVMAGSPTLERAEALMLSMGFE